MVQTERPAVPRQAVVQIYNCCAAAVLTRTESPNMFPNNKNTAYKLEPPFSSAMNYDTFTHIKTSPEFKDDHL